MKRSALSSFWLLRRTLGHNRRELNDNKRAWPRSPGFGEAFGIYLIGRFSYCVGLYVPVCLDTPCMSREGRANVACLLLVFLRARFYSVIPMIVDLNGPHVGFLICLQARKVE
jgi:hypothetical protein